MTETIPTRPFAEMEALAWLRSQPEGVVTASAAELGRRWGWNRMRTGRRLKAWEKTGLIRRNAETIIATTSVTPLPMLRRLLHRQSGPRPCLKLQSRSVP